jgi:Biotin carboxylase, N-terminal domain
MHRSVLCRSKGGSCRRLGLFTDKSNNTRYCKIGPVTGTVSPVTSSTSTGSRQTLQSSREYTTLINRHWNRQFSPISAIATTTATTTTLFPVSITQQQQQQQQYLHTFNVPDENLPVNAAFKVQVDGSLPPFTKLLAANRGEISCRINRAASELGITTAGIYSHEGMHYIYIYIYIYIVCVCVCVLLQIWLYR